MKRVHVAKEISDADIVQAAKDSGLPSAWYKGPYFDGRDIKSGVPPCLGKFAAIFWVRGFLAAQALAAT